MALAYEHTYYESYLLYARSSMHTIISPGWLARAPALSRQGGPLYEYSERDSGKD